MKEAGAAAIHSDHNQYTRPAGHPQLVNTLARYYSAELGRSLDAQSEAQKAFIEELVIKVLEHALLLNAVLCGGAASGVEGGGGGEGGDGGGGEG